MQENKTNDGKKVQKLGDEKAKNDYRKKGGIKKKSDDYKDKKPYRPDKDGFGKGEKMIRVEKKKPTRKPAPKKVVSQTSVKITEAQGEFAKQNFKAGTMLYPIPAVLVSCGNEKEANLFTVAWTGTICSDPPMLYISVRPERHSYGMIEKSGKFVVNLTTEELVNETDFCGVKSGREVNKFKEMNIETALSDVLKVPVVLKSPVNIECEVVSSTNYGTHTMFVANVVNVMVSTKYIDERGRFNLIDSGLIAYSHGKYHALGDVLQTFGGSIKKKSKSPYKAPKKS